MKKYKLKNNITLYQDSLTFKQDELITSLIDSDNSSDKIKSLINPENSKTDGEGLKDQSINAIPFLKNLFTSGAVRKFLSIILLDTNYSPLCVSMKPEEFNPILDSLPNSILTEIFSDFFLLNPEIMNLFQSFSQILDTMNQHK